MPEIEKLLEERGRTNGDYREHARIACELKDVIDEAIMARVIRGQSDLSCTQRESLHMIAHKIGRIIAGDTDHSDHWDDIAGYAKIANGTQERRHQPLGRRRARPVPERLWLLDPPLVRMGARPLTAAFRRLD